MTKQSCSWILAFEILELSATLKIIGKRTLEVKREFTDGNAGEKCTATIFA
jgi:hypothetical protein